MNKFHLTTKGRLWELQEERGATIATYDDRAEAIRSAHRTAKMETGSLTVHKSDGTVEEECSYVRAA